MAKLTKAEAKWLDELQDVLNRCPTRRLGFYTIGDPTVNVFDLTKENQINEMMEKSNKDFCTASDRLGADLGSIKFPSNVHATAG